MDRAPAISSICMAFVAMSASSAVASRTLPTDLDGLVATSAMIVEGEVETVDIAAGQSEPRTRITLRIDRLFAGASPGSRIEFDLPMGMMADGTLLDIAEAPRFAAGERYLVFYKRGQWNITPVAGWSQGYYRAVRLPGSDGQADGQNVFVSANGHCVVAVEANGFTLGPRVARPMGPPEFGQTGFGPRPSHPTTGIATDAAAACLPADDVRARLAGYLGPRAIEGAPEWHRGPAGSILRTPLAPDLGRLNKAPALHARPVCSGDAPGCISPAGSSAGASSAGSSGGRP